MRDAVRVLPVLLLLVSCSSTRTIDRPDCGFIPAGELQVRVCDTKGDGKPVVLLHGLAGSVAVWDGWMQELDGYRVIRIDLPGSGQTAPREDRDYSVEADAALIREVLRHLGIEKYALAGHSLGGYRAWFLAQEDLTRPHVTELILVAPIGLEAKPNIFDRIPRPLLALGRLVLPRRQKAVIDRIWPGHWRNHTCGLEDIEARTLILWGEHDCMRGRCCFDRRIPDSTLVVVENTGHMLVKSPETARLARKFLENTLSAEPQTCAEPCPRTRQPCVP